MGGARCARDERTRKRAADERYIYTYTSRQIHTYIYISVWRKGEYIGTKGWTGKGRERKWQEGIEERDGKRVRCADDDDHHQHRHSYRHWLGHTSVCRFPS